MERYSNYAPTSFDAKGLNCRMNGICNYGVLLSQTRDSEPWDLSNFRVALERLGGESENVIVARFGHWACGWIELILVRPNTAQWDIAIEIENSLEDYPLLDDMDASELEYEIYTDAGMVFNEENCSWEYPD